MRRRAIRTTQSRILMSSTDKYRAENLCTNVYNKVITSYFLSFCPIISILMQKMRNDITIHKKEGYIRTCCLMGPEKTTKPWEMWHEGVITSILGRESYRKFTSRKINFRCKICISKISQFSFSSDFHCSFTKNSWVTTAEFGKVLPRALC